MKRKAQRIKGLQRKIGLLKGPSYLILMTVQKSMKKSGSENNIMEEIEREKNMKNMKENAYANMRSNDNGEQAELQKIKKPKNDSKIP